MRNVTQVKGKQTIFEAQLKLFLFSSLKCRNAVFNLVFNEDSKIGVCHFSTFSILKVTLKYLNIQFHYVDIALPN
jgi:hypothetical protein